MSSKHPTTYGSTRTRDASSQDGDDDGLSLLIVSAESFASFPLPRSGAVLIGRASECDVRVMDDQASRQHARLYLAGELEIEDLHSRNGTIVRESAIQPGVRVAIAFGETIRVGETVLVPQRARPSVGHRRMWTHPYFENRLRAACARAERSNGAFALVRLRLQRPVGWARVVPLLARDLPDQDAFAAYGPNEFELLLEDPIDEIPRLLETIRTSLGHIDLPVRMGIAWYPRDGRSADALFDRANSSLRPDAPVVATFPATLSAPMKTAYTQALKAARSNLNVLLLGEMGVGKEVMARLIHEQSPRANKPYQALNCAGLPETLIESELFGYVRGAFTGAAQDRKGILEEANGGTVLLDEIGDMPLAIQGRLLRAIENKEVRPVGSSHARPIDVRFIAATNKPVEGEAARTTFREDLLFRLNGMTIRMPPLRERRAEIIPLARQFLDRAASEADRPSAPTLSSAVITALEEYAWPGNVRQLKNAMVRAVALSEGDTILLEHLPEELQSYASDLLDRRTTQPATVLLARLTSDQENEKRLMTEALEKCLWNQTKAAALIGMPRRTFVAKMSRYGIPRPRDVSSSEPGDPADDGADEPR